jgi:hypothetical protein
MAHKKRWSDLSPRTRRVLIVAGAAEACLKVAAAIDLKRRPASQVRGSKWMWGVALAVNTAGVAPLAYFVLGRQP